ncbi:MAG: hypothetical protein L6306_11655 [Planctomycetales bacterium]|nr:hypothetical protein [Planctomycetales bacterium]
MGQAQRSPTVLFRVFGGTALRLSHPTFLCCVLAMFFAVCAVCVASPAGAEEFADPREQFRALGVEDAYFDRLADGGPMTRHERETLLRVLFRLRIFPPVDLDRWAMDADLLETAIQQPKDYRGLIFRLRGRVTDVRPFNPPPEAAERYELKKYYRCRLKLDALEQSVVVYTETVPKQWQRGAKPNASCGALGVFLKLTKPAGATAGSSSSAGTTPLFVAPRLAWYPNNLLGRLGMDAGLFDTVENQEPLTKKDHAAFYEMLAAVGRTKPGRLLRQAEANLPEIPAKWRWTNREGQELYSVVPLFNEPKNQLGRLVALRGTARLVEEVFVDEPDIAAQYGVDHYYQLMLFTDDSQGNPLTFCVRELPEGMPHGNIPRYGESVLVAGFFFKTWSYPIRRQSDEGLSPGEPKTRLQLSPLLIGRSLVWRPPPKPADQTRANVIVGGLFIAAMIVVWIVAWRSMRRERRWVDRAIGGPPKDFSPPEGG